MKFTKLSLAAMIAMGVASSAFAVENVKVDGQIKLWYQTMDAKNSSDQSIGTTDTTEADGLFKKDGATGDLVAKLRTTGDLTKKVGFGATLYAVSTMGLENNLVSGEAIGVTSTDNAGNTALLNGSDKLPMWLGEAYITYKAGKTIAKIGRQELDTPLAFTETWNAAPNTFEAAVLVNQDLPDTTVVAAYVSRGNGYNNSYASGSNGVNASTVTNGSFYNYHSTFVGGDDLNQALGGGDSLAAPGDKGGAYAIGFVNKSIPNLTLHPVYYNVLDTAKAFWADATYVVPNIVKIEAAYANVDPQGGTQKVLDYFNTSTAVAGAVNTSTTTAYAAQVSGDVAGVRLAGAYSNVGKGFMPVGNTATGFKKTKIYTASILSDGTVAGRPDTTGWKLAAGYDIAGFKLDASYGSYKVGKNDNKANWFNAANAIDVNVLALGANSASAVGAPAGVEYSPSEIDLSISTKIDEVNLALYFINVKEAYKSANTNGFTRDLQAIRAVASINF